MNNKFQVGENITYNNSFGGQSKGIVRQVLFEANGQISYQIASEGSSVVEVPESRILTLLNG